VNALDLISEELARNDRAAVTSSFQAECVVLVHLIRRVRPHIPVLFLDTAHHFPDTLSYRDRIATEWGLNLVTLAPAPAIGLWRDSTEACCAHHKVGPLFAALDAYDTWFTGLRREQSRSRTELPAIAPFASPSGRTLRKVSPLAEWTTRDVWAYARANEIPLLPLYDRGFTSIGCEPCTTRPIDPADPRSGRWAGRKLECGIHISAPAAPKESGTPS
jgi:phosphoadenosine phosphosulfate reductase